MSNKYRFKLALQFWQDYRRVTLGLTVLLFTSALGFGSAHVVVQWHMQQQRDRDQLILNRAISQRWDGNYQRCLDQVANLSAKSAFYTQAQDLRYECQNELARQSIAQAQSFAVNGEFKAAILMIDQVPDGFYPVEVQRLTETWSKRILEIAEAYFLNGELSKAVATANSLPEENALRAVALAQIGAWQALWAVNQAHYQSAAIALKLNDLEVALSEVNQINADRSTYWTAQVNSLIDEISIKQQEFAALLRQAEQAKLQGQCQAATQLASELPETRPWSEKKTILLEEIEESCRNPSGLWAEIIAGILIVLGELLTRLRGR